MNQEFSWNTIFAVNEYFSSAKISPIFLGKLADDILIKQALEAQYFPCCVTLFENITNKRFDLNTVFDKKNTSSIKFLFLRALYLKDIFPIKEFSNLEIIDCGWENSIDSIVPLEGLVFLKEIYLPRNKIHNLNPISKLSNIEILDLSENQIYDVNKLMNLEKLRVLNVSGNKIRDVFPISNLKNLERLDLSANELEDVRTLKSLKNLTVLNLCFNSAIDLQGVLEVVRSLRDCKILLDSIDNHQQLLGYLFIKNIDGNDVLFLIDSPVTRSMAVEHVYVKLLDESFKVHIRIIEEMKSIARQVITRKERESSFVRHHVREQFFYESQTLVSGQFDY